MAVDKMPEGIQVVRAPGADAAIVIKTGEEFVLDPPYAERGAHMMPIQATGTCYLHAALNIIVNCPQLLDAVLLALKARIETNKFASKPGESLEASRARRGFKTELALTNRRMQAPADLANDTGRKNAERLDAVKSVKEYLDAIREPRADDASAKKQLVQWVADTVLHTSLRRAATKPMSANAFKRTFFDQLPYSAATDASMAPVMAKYDEITGSDAVVNNTRASHTQIQKDSVYAYSSMLSGGDTDLAFKHLLENVGAKVERLSVYASVATLPGGLRVVTVRQLLKDEGDSSIRDQMDACDRLDLWGHFAVGGGVCRGEDASGHESGHAIMYRRLDDGSVQIIDSNTHEPKTYSSFRKSLNDSQYLCGSRYMTATRVFVSSPADGQRGGGDYDVEPVPSPDIEEAVTAAQAIAVLTIPSQDEPASGETDQETADYEEAMAMLRVAAIPTE